jgi:hypothetical protein
MTTVLKIGIPSENQQFPAAVQTEISPEFIKVIFSFQAYMVTIDKLTL